ncbi:hypothetical protein HK101_002234 [Irineochytrium annulatum]|nr:hypothetical protein HK101_002234 [Irineochytrium annulatum]
MARLERAHRPSLQPQHQQGHRHQLVLPRSTVTIEVPQTIDASPRVSKTGKFNDSSSYHLPPFGVELPQTAAPPPTPQPETLNSLLAGRLSLLQVERESGEVKETAALRAAAAFIRRRNLLAAQAAVGPSDAVAIPGPVASAPAPAPEPVLQTVNRATVATAGVRAAGPPRSDPQQQPRPHTTGSFPTPVMMVTIKDMGHRPRMAATAGAKRRVVPVSFPPKSHYTHRELLFMQRAAQMNVQPLITWRAQLDADEREAAKLAAQEVRVPRPPNKVRCQTAPMRMQTSHAKPRTTYPLVDVPKRTAVLR